MKNRLQTNSNIFDYGFGLVDAIVSMSLLVGVITYGVYFSSLRLNTVYQSNLIRAINKEIQRDIERLKSDLWSIGFEEELGQYNWCLDDLEKCERLCESSSLQITINQDTEDQVYSSWNLEGNEVGDFVQSWTPGAERSKVFSEEPVLITRELKLETPLLKPSLNQSISSVSYRVQWGIKDIHWLSIYLTPEAHGWCKQLI